MSNGKIIAEIRSLVAGGGRIAAATRDRLMLAAIADIYDKLDNFTNAQAEMQKEVQNMKPWVSLVKWIAGVLGAAILVLLFEMLTHKFDWPF